MSIMVSAPLGNMGFCSCLAVGRVPDERPALPDVGLGVPANQLPAEDGGDDGGRGRPRRRLLRLRRADLGGRGLQVQGRGRDEVS